MDYRNPACLMKQNILKCIQSENKYKNKKPPTRIYLLKKKVHENLKSRLICFNKPFEPPHDKTNEMACVPSEDSDQPVHLPSLIRVFAVCSVGSLGPEMLSCGQGRL